MPPTNGKLTETRLVVFLIAIAVASTLPFFLAAHGSMAEAHDLYIHSARMMKFDDALRSGVWYPRWLGGMNYNFGAATTLFYAPLFYYLVSAAHAVLGDWPWAIGAVAVLAASATAVAFYVYVRNFVSAPGSFIATMLYLLFPYHLIDLYHRGAFPELIGFVLMPLVLASLLSAVKKRSVFALVGGAAAFSLLILTHPPSAYLFGLTSGVYFGVLGWLWRSWRPIVLLGAVGVIGVGLSAVYLVPAIGELRYCRQHVTESFPYKNAFVDQLLAGTRFQVMIGVTVLVSAVTFVAYSAILFRAVSKGAARSESRVQSIAWTVAGALSILMMTPLMRPLVGALPGLEAVAFPWRWLGTLGLATSVMGGLVFDRIALQFKASAKLERPFRMLVIIVVVVTVGGLVFGALSSGLASNLSRPFVASTVFVEEDFTPRDAVPVADLPLGREVEMMSGRPETSARVVEWKPEQRTIETASDAPDTLHVYSFMFRGWTARIEGRQVEIRTNPALGTILVDLPAGAHRVKLAFENTRMRVIGEWVSAATALFLIVVSVWRGLSRGAVWAAK